jgi:hypothetical protein
VPVMVPRVRVRRAMVLMELTLGPFVAAGLGSPLPAGAEPVDGALVLLVRMSHDVMGWPVVDAGARPPAFRIPSGLGFPGPGQNPTLIRMVGDFHGQSWPTGPNDDQAGQREGCSSTENVHGSLRGMTSFAMTLAGALTMSSRGVHQSPQIHPSNLEHDVRGRHRIREMD